MGDISTKFFKLKTTGISRNIYPSTLIFHKILQIMCRNVFIIHKNYDKRLKKNKNE